MKFHDKNFVKSGILQEIPLFPWQRIKVKQGGHNGPRVAHLSLPDFVV